MHGMLMELREVMLLYFRAGQGVRLEGLGIFAPKINLEGVIRLMHWPDKPLVQRLNKGEFYTGKILNRDMIGKTTEDLIARWNEDHPGQNAVTTIETGEWYPAEDYHQEYWEGEGQRNPYCLAVIPPKLMKLRKSFQQYLKPEA